MIKKKLRWKGYSKEKKRNILIGLIALSVLIGVGLFATVQAFAVAPTSGDATVQVQTYGPVYEFVVKMMLAICLASPITWFIFWCFSREPSKKRYRYR